MRYLYRIFYCQIMAQTKTAETGSAPKANNQKSDGGEATGTTRFLFYIVLVILIINNLHIFFNLLIILIILAALFKPVQDYIRRILEDNWLKLALLGIGFIFFLAFFSAYEIFETFLPWIILFRGGS